MSGFDAGWLRLRAPYDDAARNPELLARLTAWRRRHHRLGLIDLGAGTGATLRVLAPLLGGEQRWLLVDHDPALLAAQRPETQAWAEAKGYALTARENGFTVSGDGFRAEALPFRADLSARLDALPTEGAQLVTASALLDLVSAAWLDRLVALCRDRRLGCYAALSYDGRLDWSPTDRLDAAMHALFDRHQRQMKSFGPALGPDAAALAEQRFRAAGFTVQAGRSDWRMEAADRDMQEALLGFYVQSAREIDPAQADAIDHWRQRRGLALGAGHSRHSVGHVDILALTES